MVKHYVIEFDAFPNNLLVEYNEPAFFDFAAQKILELISGGYFVSNWKTTVVKQEED